MKKTLKKQIEHIYGKPKHLSKEEQKRLGEEPIDSIKSTVERHDAWQKRALSADARPL